MSTHSAISRGQARTDTYSDSDSFNRFKMVCISPQRIYSMLIFALVAAGIFCICEMYKFIWEHRRNALWGYHGLVRIADRSVSQYNTRARTLRFGRFMTFSIGTTTTKNVTHAHLLRANRECVVLHLRRWWKCSNGETTTTKTVDQRWMFGIFLKLFLIAKNAVAIWSSNDFLFSTPWSGENFETFTDVSCVRIPMESKWIEIESQVGRNTWNENSGCRWWRWWWRSHQIVKAHWYPLFPIELAFGWKCSECCCCCCCVGLMR